MHSHDPAAFRTAQEGGARARSWAQRRALRPCTAPRPSSGPGATSGGDATRAHPHAPAANCPRAVLCRSAPRTCPRVRPLMSCSAKPALGHPLNKLSCSPAGLRMSGRVPAAMAPVSMRVVLGRTGNMSRERPLGAAPFYTGMAVAALALNGVTRPLLQRPGEPLLQYAWPSAGGPAPPVGEAPLVNGGGGRGLHGTTLRAGWGESAPSDAVVGSCG